MSDLIKRRSIAELMLEGGRIAAELSLGADTDEELDAKQDAFASWLAECEDKGLACKVVIKALDAEAQRFRDAEKQIADKRRQIEAHADKLRERTLALAESMLEGTGKKSVDLADGGKLTVTERVNLEIEVTDPMLLPDGCGEWKFVPDKTAIKAAYKATGAVPGAKVTETAAKSLTVK